MSPTFLRSTTNKNIIYSPDISNKVILEATIKNSTFTEFRVVWGNANNVVGNNIIHSFDNLDQAEKWLTAMSGYGKPKPAFEGHQQVRKSSTNTPSMNNTSLLDNKLETSIEKALRKKWNIQ